jgi:hypothetical protein
MGKYDISGSLTPVQSTFVDPGLETFKEAAMIYRKTYDQNKDAYNLSKRVTAQMDLMPGDEKAGLRDQFTNTIDGTFSSIVNTGNFEDAEMAVQNAVDFITTDKTVLQARKNSAEYLREEALIEQFGPSGVLDFNKNARENFTTVTTDENGEPIVNSYKEQMEKKEDYFTLMKNMVSGIAPDGRPWSETIGNLTKYGNQQGVSSGKVQRIVNKLYEAYVGDKAGDQDFRRLTQIEGMSEGQAKEDIIRRLVGAAAPQVGNIIKISGMRENANLNSDGTPVVNTGPLSPLNSYLQSTEKQAVSYDEILAMSGGVEGRIPGSFAYNQDGITINYATQLSDAEQSKVSDFLMKNDLAADPQDAMEMIGPLAAFQTYYASGEVDKALEIGIDLGFMTKDEGFSIPKANQISAVANNVSQLTNADALNNMGSLLNVEGVRGDFTPNTGSNMQTVGSSFLIDGTLRFNEDQMNNIANSMGWGTVGSAFGWDIDMLPGTTVDVENIEGVDGKPMFRREEDDKGTPYWYMDATYKTDFSTSKEAAVFDVRNTENQYGDYDVPMADASADVVLMKNIKRDKYSHFSNTITKQPGLRNKATVKKVYDDYAKHLVRVTTKLGGTSSDYNTLLMRVENAIIDVTKTNSNPSRQELQEAIQKVLPQ